MSGDAITILIILVAIAGFLSVFFSVCEIEYKKSATEGGRTVRLILPIIYIFLFFMLVCYGGCVVFLIMRCFGKASFTEFIVSESSFLLFFLVSVSGFIAAKYDYLIIKSDCILIKKPLSKIRKVNYTDIVYYSKTENILESVCCYDGYGVPMFSVSQFHKGSDGLTEILKEKEVAGVSYGNGIKRQKNTPQYKRYVKLNNCKIITGGLFFIDIIFLFLFIIIFIPLKWQNFENYKVSGIVDTWNIKNQVVEFAIDGDDAIYWVSNLDYNNLDKSLFDDLKEDSVVTFTIAHIDEYGRNVVSGINFNGKMYLDPKVSEDTAYSNYKSMRIFSFAVLGIVGLFSVLTVLFGIKSLNLKKQTMGREL